MVYNFLAFTSRHPIRWVADNVASVTRDTLDTRATVPSRLGRLGSERFRVRGYGGCLGQGRQKRALLAHAGLAP